MSPDWVIYLQSLSWDAAIKVSLAALLGAIVGLERVAGGHPAGLRTNMMIAISSCLFTILSIEGFPRQGSSQDTARVAAQIVTAPTNDVMPETPLENILALYEAVQEADTLLQS